MDRSENTVASAPPLRGKESKDTGSGHARRRQSGKPTNKCSCGQIIANVKGEKTPSASPRHQLVFDRLYRDRVKRELNRRELAAKVVENDARESTYIPLTKNVRRQMDESSSLSSMANRELRVEKAREQFKGGTIRVDCLKKVEIGTGTYLLEAVMGHEEVSAQPSRQGSFVIGSDLHPPREIIMAGPPMKEKTAMKPKIRSRSFRRSIKNGISLIASPVLVNQQESRNDESATQKSSLPHRALSTASAFSFDIVSPISSLESRDSGSRASNGVPSTHIHNSTYDTPGLGNSIAENWEEMREEVGSKGTMEVESKDDASRSTGSSTTSGVPLRLLSYVEVESTNSVPFDEQSAKLRACSYTSLLVTDSDEQIGAATSSTSAYSLSSILDRDSFIISDQKVISNSNDEAKRKAEDLAYVGCEMDPTECECIDSCDYDKKSGIVQPATNNNSKNECVTLFLEKPMDNSYDKDAALVEEKDWLDELTNCLVCEKEVPNILPGSRYDLQLMLTCSPSDEAVKKAMDCSNAGLKPYSSKCHSNDTNSCADDEKSGIVQPTTNNSPKNECATLFREKPIDDSCDKDVALVEERDWLDRLTECLVCEKDLPNMTIASSPSEEAVKKSMDESNAVSASYSTNCHSIDLTPPKDWETRNSRKSELIQAPSDEEDWVKQNLYQLTSFSTCVRTVTVQEKDWLEQRLDQVTEFATCGMLDK